MPDIGQALVDAQVVTPDQLQEAQRAGGSLTSVLVERNMVDEHQMVGVLTRTFGLQEASLGNVEPDPELLQLVPEKTARSLGMLPFKKEGAMLHVATSDPRLGHRRRRWA